MQSASLIYMRVSPFPKSTKTSVYVGQWGRLRFEGGSITANITSEAETNYPKPQIITCTKKCLRLQQIITIYKSDTEIHKLDTRYANSIQRYTNVTRCTRYKQFTYISQACPKWHLLHLDCLHWQPITKVLKDQRKWCLPKWDTQSLTWFTPQ